MAGRDGMVKYKRKAKRKTEPIAANVFAGLALSFPVLLIEAGIYNTL